MTTLQRFSTIAGAILSTAALLTLLNSWLLGPIHAELKANRAQLSTLESTLNLAAWALAFPDSSDEHRRAVRQLSRRWLDTRTIRLDP
jgi:hypothetical protein